MKNLSLIELAIFLSATAGDVSGFQLDRYGSSEFAKKNDNVK